MIICSKAQIIRLEVADLARRRRSKPTSAGQRNEGEGRRDTPNHPPQLALKKRVGEPNTGQLDVRAPLRETSNRPSNAPKPRLDSQSLSPRGERHLSLQPRELGRTPG
ncbi:hypothetical protein JTB14_028169 [Gonioctena quinquepunctata]|nr:hypothetical protein JTB14_028169 [Gonioctena quinquepunctata]